MTTVEIKLRELETRVTWLEQAIRELRDSEQFTPVDGKRRNDLSERERLLAELKADGLVRDPTPKEQASAAEWNALLEDEKQAIIRELRDLKSGPMLSDIVIENRR